MSANAERPSDLAQRLAALIDDGLTFGECVNVFAERQGKCDAIIDAATEQYYEGGSVEIDSNAIVSVSADDGAYVMAWVWVDSPVSEGAL